MEVVLPETISAETLEMARPAIEALRTLLADDRLPAWLTREAVRALLTVMDGVIESSAEDENPLTPSQAAERLRVARPSVMRLISRGELSSRKEGGHYVLSPREVRVFQARLASVRREALADLTRMADEFDF